MPLTLRKRAFIFQGRTSIGFRSLQFAVFQEKDRAFLRVKTRFFKQFVCYGYALKQTRRIRSDSSS
jgi:hypothetical protein